MLLTVHGDSLLYEGAMDDETYRGIGIWDPATGTLAVDFVEERTKLHGVAHFVLKEGLLHSRWAFFDEPGSHRGVDAGGPVVRAQELDRPNFSNRERDDGQECPGGRRR
jgi:hypothetical protein